MTGRVLLKLQLSAVGGHFWFTMPDKTDVLTPSPCKYAIKMSIKGYDEKELRAELRAGEGASVGETFPGATSKDVPALPITCKV